MRSLLFIFFNQADHNILEKSDFTRIIKSEAERLGFSGCGISRAGYLKEDSLYLISWLKKKKNGRMAFLRSNTGKRSDPTILFNGASSVISVILNYYPERLQKQKNVPEISKYAYGKDYHLVMKDRLEKLLANIKDRIPDLAGRIFVGTAPVLEKAWARKSGLGWIGRNSLLITKQFGSYVFIGELIVNIDLDYDEPAAGSCGSCKKCIDACPTKALSEPYQVDCTKCISYYTIEYRGRLPEKLRSSFNKWVYGCDICQDVCPWNKNAVSHDVTEFYPHEDILKLTKEDWYIMTEESFDRIFKDSAIGRIKYETLRRNLDFIKEHI